MYYKQSHFYGIKLRVRIEIIACLLCLPFPFLTFLSAHAKWSKTLKFKHLTQHAITDEQKRRLKYWCSGSRHVANAVQQTREIMCFLQFSYVMHWPFTRGVHKEKKKSSLCKIISNTAHVSMYLKSSMLCWFFLKVFNDISSNYWKKRKLSGEWEWFLMVYRQKDIKL